jgi:hypothetical protein
MTKAELRAASKAADAKLQAYSKGHKAAKGNQESEMYLKLNKAASEAAAKLPWYLR